MPDFQNLLLRVILLDDRLFDAQCTLRNYIKVSPTSGGDFREITQALRWYGGRVPSGPGRRYPGVSLSGKG